MAVKTKTLVSLSLPVVWGGDSVSARADGWVVGDVHAGGGGECRPREV